MDYLTLDYLAEVSLSIMASQKARNPDLGYAQDFVGVVKSLTPFWKNGQKTRIVTNAGGLNPRACAQAIVEVLREAGLTDMKVGLVTGDDVLPIIQAASGDEASLNHLESGASIASVHDQLFTANAYTGARGAVEALDQGADIVVTGRLADPSMAVAPCIHHFGWADDEWDKIAGATIAGHVIECGCQACGGISTDWLDLPDVANMGFPIVEVSDDGSFVVTMPDGCGGLVNEDIVKEQLLYEIADPDNYLSPDVKLTFLSLKVEEIGVNRVLVTGAKGFEPPSTYKVSATYREGYNATGQLTIFGHDAIAKAKKSGEIILERLRRAGYEYARTNIECLGAGACVPGIFEEPKLLETVLRISVADPRKEAITRFSKEIAVLACGGAQGTTGYAGGRPRVSPVFGFWPCLIEKEKLEIRAEVLAV